MTKYVCPRCFELQDLDDVEYICLNQKCSRGRSGKPFRVEGRPKKPRCDECGQVLAKRVCPMCGFEIPENIDTGKNLPIALIGAKECGKSNYVAVLIDQLKNDVGRAFDCALMAGEDNTIKRYRAEFYNPVFRNKTCVRGTDRGAVEPLIYTILFQRQQKGLFKSRTRNDAVSLTFFDTAGENLKSLDSMRTFNGYLSHAAGIILLLDPLQIPSVRNELEGKIRLPEENTDAAELLTRTVEIIRSQNEIERTQKIDIPIAIAFTKIDAVDDLLDPSSCLKNDSRHIQNGFFDRNDFNDANEEMQSLLEHWTGQELSQIIELNFSKYGFFGLSALGSNPDMDNKIPRFRPFRVTDPFLWLLAENGIIPSG